tara:strand:+ start:2898 stop:3311 length:414 start_codon:yes stop_codon:yes gene_type:complete
MELDDAQLEQVIGGTSYPSFLSKWKQYIRESAGFGSVGLPSGIPSSPCPQGTQQLGFLEDPDENGDPVARCVPGENSPPSVMDAEIKEDFQQDVKKKHRQMKIRLIGKGGNKKKAAPYDQNPSYDRSKSAPPGFGGS